jgi:hypothetical protein
MHLLAAVASLGRLLRFSSARRHRAVAALPNQIRATRLCAAKRSQGKTVDELAAHYRSIS